MIFATTIFFEPDWPQRLLRRGQAVVETVENRSWTSLPRASRLGIALLAAYCLVHVALPFRQHLDSGDPNWTERGQHFAWRMMLRVKDSALRYYLTDAETGVTGTADLRRFVNLEQLSKSSRDPEMILHLAHHLALEYRRATGRDVEVRALVLTTLNGRKPELLIDPNVDLAKEPRGFYRRPWIMPQREPLRDVAWSAPITQWERYVEIPRLSFLERGRSEAMSPPSTRQAPRKTQIVGGLQSSPTRSKGPG
jgi:hypothetical protein